MSGRHRAPGPVPEEPGEPPRPEEDPTELGGTAKQGSTAELGGTAKQGNAAEPGNTAEEPTEPGLAPGGEPSGLEEALAAAAAYGGAKFGLALALPASVEAEVIADIANQGLPFEVVRRCGEAAEILGLAQAGLIRAAVIDTELVSLDRDLLERLEAHFVAVIVFVRRADAQRHSYLQALGTVYKEELADLFAPGPLLSEASRILAKLCQILIPPPPPPAKGRSVQSLPPGPGEVPLSSVLAVWGSGGAPGRSTLAVNLAAQLGRTQSVLLIDFDSFDASLVQMLAQDLGASGVAAASRLALQGSLNIETLRSHCQAVGAKVDLLSGLTRAERWRELTESAVREILQVARQGYEWVVVDLPAGLEENEAEFFAPTRYQSTLAALAEADLILLVGRSDPVGMRRLLQTQRLVATHPQLSEQERLVVANQARRGIAGHDPLRAVEHALTEHLGKEDFRVLPYDQAACDKALLEGTDIATVAPDSALSLALAALGEEIRRILGRSLTPRRPRRQGRSGSQRRRSWSLPWGRGRH